nr:hypothetical protein [Tanacetum cinerariifolium]
EFGKSTSRDGKSTDSYYTRFYRMMNEMQQINLDKVSYHKLLDILKQHQSKVDEIRAERMARNANPLALVVAAQHYPDDYTQAPKPYKSHTQSSRQTPLTIFHATTRNKGKEIVKPYSPLYEFASEEDSDEEQAQRDKHI